MKTLVKSVSLLTVLFVTLTGCSSLMKSDSNSGSSMVNSPLIGMLTEKLGVTNQQATGGAGAILGYAKNKLSPENYEKVTSAMPETNELIKAAPAESKLDKMTASVSGDSAASAGGLSALAGSFSQLGMGPDAISGFVPVIMDYAKSKGGSNVSVLLGSVLQ